MAHDEPDLVATTGGGAVAAWDFGGSDAGAPLFFAHATGLHTHVWAPIIDLLTPRHHCYGFDLRGHGHSPVPPGPPEHGFSWDGFGDDALAVIDHFGLTGDRRPFGIGHSCGGGLSILAEASRPGTYRGMWLFEPVAPPVGVGMDGPVPESHLAVGARKRRQVFASKQAAYDNYASKPPYDACDPESLRQYVEWGFDDDPEGVRLRCSGDSEAWTFTMAGASGVFTKSVDVRCPTVVSRGDGMGSFSADWLVPLAARMGDGRGELLSGLSHFGPMEDPPRIAAAITDAVASAIRDVVTPPE